MTLDAANLEALRVIAHKVTTDYDSIGTAEIVKVLQALPSLIEKVDDSVSHQKVEYIVSMLERQNRANDSYAANASNSNDGELWLICNSHVKDWTRNLRALLTP